MPTCPTTPPPVLALALPWEAPLNYAAVLALAGLACLVVWFVYIKAAKPLTSRACITFAFLIAGLVCFVVGTGSLLLVLMPYSDHVFAWSNALISAIPSQGCIQLGPPAPTDSLMNMVDGWEWVAQLVATVGFAVYTLSFLLMRPALRRHTS